MKLSLISWNRGLNDPGKYSIVKKYATRVEGDVVRLQETMMEIVRKEVLRSLWGVICRD
jgi:hypothetical protein